MAARNISKTLVWILMGLLILGLGGFGVTNLSGTVRSVGSVGDADIDVTDYFRALQADIAALEAERGEPVSFAQARDLGLTDAVLARMVAVAALDHETARLGISIGDQNLRDQIVAIRQFQGLDGSFDREAYAFSLERTGMSEAQFEQNMREETSRALLQAAIVAGVNTPAAYSDTMLNYLGERRNVTWAVLERGDLATGLTVPSEDDLSTYHQSHASAFTSPEVKRITYAWLAPSMIIDSVEIDADSLRAAYDERIDEFNQPERRLVERLAFPDAPAAEAAMARIGESDASFEDVVGERGLELADIDLGDVSESELEAAGAAVFAAEVGDVIGPLDTPIGPALFRINAVLAAQETSFEDAQPMLRDELAGDRARRVVDAQIDGVDDLLAGGATIEDLAKETEMKLGQIDWHAGMSDEIGAYEAFRAAAAAVTANDYPDVIQLDDGGIFAMRLDEIVEPALRPLDEVRDQVLEQWRADAAVEALKAQVDAQLPSLRDGASFEEAGLTPQTAADLTRRGFQPDTPGNFIETAFDLEKGDVGVIEGNGRVFVLRVDDILPPDESDADLEQLRILIEDQTASSMSEDLYQILANDIRARAGITLDQQALNAVHANFQ